MLHVLTESVGGEIYLYKLFVNFEIWFYNTVIKWTMQCESELWHWVCEKYISLLRTIFKNDKKRKFDFDITPNFQIYFLTNKQSPYLANLFRKMVFFN
jgi:hypothetical protein